MTYNRLTEGSTFYYSEAEIYNCFAEAEDAPDFVLDYLLEQVRDKIVLDVGCGTGKYMRRLHGDAVHYYGLDVSKDALACAGESLPKSDKISFLCSSAETIDLPENSVDLVFSAWVLGTILDKNRREAALRECLRTVKEGHPVLFIENDIGGEFERMRGRYPDCSRTREYNTWLEDHGFSAIKRFDSYFGFKSKEEAQQVIASIWGDQAGQQVASQKIWHKIVVYQYCW